VSYEISIKRFRNAVDRIKKERDSALVKTLYLLAARNSEVLTKTNPLELLNNKTKSYGNFMKIKFANYEVAPRTPDKEPLMQKVMVITTAVAKRGKRLKQPKEEEEQTTPELKKEEVIEALTKYGETKLLDKWQAGEVEIDPLLIKVLLGKVALKIVALPCSNVYEPWVMDLLEWIRKTKKMTLSFDLTRSRVLQILREHLSEILGKPDKKNPRNPLRHYRISHLIEYYGLDAYQLTSYVGWKIGSTFSAMGIAASPNIDAYAHLRWRLYFPKLLKPLANFN